GGGDAVAPIGKSNKSGRPSEGRGAANLLGAGRNEWCAVGLDPHVMEMHVRVDAAWHDDMPRCLDHAGRRRLDGKGPGRRQRRDCLSRNTNVTVYNAFRCNDISAANDQIEHAIPPLVGPLLFAARSSIALGAPRILLHAPMPE